MKIIKIINKVFNKNNMIINLIKLIKILDNKDQFKLIILFLMTIIAMGLEVISIVAVLPVIENFYLLNKTLIF